MGGGQDQVFYFQTCYNVENHKIFFALQDLWNTFFILQLWCDVNLMKTQTFIIMLFMFKNTIYFSYKLHQVRIFVFRHAYTKRNLQNFYSLGMFQVGNPPKQILASRKPHIKFIQLGNFKKCTFINMHRICAQCEYQTNALTLIFIITYKVE